MPHALSAGRVLWSAATPATDETTHAAPSALKVAALVILLPLYFQTFAYVIDIKPLYALAKGWPLITLPLALWALVRPGPGYKGPLLAAIAWLIAVAPLINAAGLGSGLLGALTPTVKVWPLFFGLSLLATLDLIRPSPRAILTAFAILGVTTFALLGLLWKIIPASAYTADIETTKVLLYDLERGLRLNLPMVFGIFGILLAGRSFWARPSWWQPVAIVLGFAMMIGIYKTRMPIAGTVATLVLAAGFAAGRWRGVVFGAMVAAGAILLVPVLTYLQGDGLAGQLGGSLSMRQREAQTALAYLNDAPWRWIFGAGSATRVGDQTLADFLGVNFFYLSDLGWLGVVFEYGLMGAGLMLALHLVALPLGWKASEGAPVLGGALFDYAVYLLITSPIVFVVLAPGELASVLALCAYLVRTRPPPPY